MAIIDILKYNGPNNVLVWKWRPANGGMRQEELRWGTQLIVNPTQQAIFIHGGRITDIFEAGTHTLTTENLPILSSIIGLAFGRESPFKAEVYFFNKAIAMDNKFGLIPFNMLEPNFRVPIPITSRGSFAINVSDTRKFFTQIVGTVPDFEAEKIAQYFRGVIVENIKTAIVKISREQKISPLELESIVIDVSTAIKEILTGILSQYGLNLVLFNIEAISVIDDDPRVKKVWKDYQKMMSEDIEERMRLKRRAENLDMYKVERTFDTTESAAKNIGSNGGLNLLGGMVGMGLTQPLGNAMSNMMEQAMPLPKEAPTDTNNLNKSDIIQLLKELGELKALGILTEEEFTEKKKEYLAKL